MTKVSKTKSIPRNLIVILLITIPLSTGCSGNFGNYKRSNDVNKIFESLQILPDHNYYYSGSDVEPEAIIAVHKSYTLTSADLWWKTEPDSKKLKGWVDNMNQKITRPSKGYYILDPNGKQVGMYYTPWNKGFVKMEGENHVSIGLPGKDERTSVFERIIQ